MGCKVKANQHGKLALSVHWNGRRFWEGTSLPDTGRNRKELDRLAALITAEIRANCFTSERYLHYFPNGNHAHEFRPAETTAAAPPVTGMTVNEYFELWIKRQQPPFVRSASARDYRQNITRNVLPVAIKTADGYPRPLGELRVTEITAPILLQLRDKLSSRGLALKTVRNIIDASFRAMMRDARAIDQLIDRDPFTGLVWPRMPTRVSRYLGSEGATKTAHSERTVRLLPDVRDVLRRMRPIHVTEDSYVFVNAKNGGPIEQHYGRFLASRVDDQLALLSAPASRAGVEPRMRKTATFGGGLQFQAERPLWNKASPTVPSWNQILQWLREMDLLRQAKAA